MEERKRKEYLAKAAEAEAHVQRATGTSVKESWLEIAREYDTLAKGAPKAS